MEKKSGELQYFYFLKGSGRFAVFTAFVCVKIQGQLIDSREQQTASHAHKPFSLPST